MKRRSIGVTCFGVLFIVGSSLGLLSLVAIPPLVQSALGAPGMTPELEAQLRQALQMLQSRAPLMGLQSLIGLVMGIGLLMLKRWAWWTVFLVTGAKVIVATLSVVGSNAAGPERTTQLIILIGMLAWSGLIVWFFLRPSVKAQFVKSATSDK